jgi:hypothetical protein
LAPQISRQAAPTSLKTGDNNHPSPNTAGNRTAFVPVS